MTLHEEIGSKMWNISDVSSTLWDVLLKTDQELEFDSRQRHRIFFVQTGAAAYPATCSLGGGGGGCVFGDKDASVYSWFLTSC